MCFFWVMLLLIGPINVMILPPTKLFCLAMWYLMSRCFHLQNFPPLHLLLMTFLMKTCILHSSKLSITLHFLLSHPLRVSPLLSSLVLTSQGLPPPNRLLLSSLLGCLTPSAKLSIIVLNLNGLPLFATSPSKPWLPCLPAWLLVVNTEFISLIPNIFLKLF